MPTYQYVCTDCDRPLEVVQSFSDDALTECPECQGKLRKVFGSVGVVFKGSGFYRNDSRSTSTSTSPAAPSTSSSGSDTGSAPSKSDSSSSSSDSGSTSGSTSAAGHSITPAAATP